MSIRRRKFGTIQKFLFVFVFGALVWGGSWAFDTFGGTVANITLSSEQDVGIDSGLVLHWTLDGKNRNPTTAIDVQDISGSSKHGTSSAKNFATSTSPLPSTVASTTIFITDTTQTTWVVPADWSDANIIEVIGAGAAGDNGGGSGSGGGGGGAYSKRVSLTGLRPGQVVTVQVGLGGDTDNEAGTDTFFGRTSGAATTCTAGVMYVCAKGGGASAGVPAGGAGGAAASGIGDQLFSGGNGGSGNAIDNGGGGGGAGGPWGNGRVGGTAVNTTEDGGAGGGGAGGGSVGAANSATAGGAGGNGYRGTGSGAGGNGTQGSPGTAGGGGGGGEGTGSLHGGNGGWGVEWTGILASTGQASTTGAGGGGGGNSANTIAFAAGSGGGYGGGGGGGEGTPGFGNGANGIIAITYWSGPSSAPGRIGQAFNFDGTGQNIQAGDVDGGSTVKTVSFWIKAATTTASQSLIHFDISDGDYIGTNSSSAVTATGFTATSIYVDGSTASAVIPDFNWHHVVMTFSTGWNADDFAVASTTALKPFGGQIDDVRLFNRVITQDEVNRLMQLGGTTKINRTIDTQPNLMNGLVGWWTFDGKNMNVRAATANVLDSSGQGNSGNIEGMDTGTTTVPGAMGQALKFDGTDDYVNLTVSSALDLNSNYTLSAWIKPDTITGGISEATILKRGTDGSNSDPDGQYWLRISQLSGILAFVTSDGTTNQSDTFGAVPANTWSFVLCTHNGTTKTCYINGVVTGTPATDTVGDFTGTENLEIIGCTNTTCNAGQFIGSIDDVRIYNRVLTQDEITQLYKLGGTAKMNTTIDTQDSLGDSLKGWWTFDGRDISVNPNRVYDRSGNNLFGTTTGMSTGTTTAPGRVGQAFDFDGTDDAVRLGQTTNLMRNVGGGTITAWVKRHASASLDPIIDINTATNGDRFQLAVDSSDRARIISRAGDAEGTQVLTISSPRILPADGWVFLTATIDIPNDFLEIFKNGVSIGSTAGAFTASATSDTSPSEVNIGFDGSTGFFDGFIDDLRVYERVLTVDEIRRIYELGK